MRQPQWGSLNEVISWGEVWQINFKLKLIFISYLSNLPGLSQKTFGRVEMAIMHIFFAKKIPLILRNPKNPGKCASGTKHHFSHVCVSEGFSRQECFGRCLKLFKGCFMFHGWLKQFDSRLSDSYKMCLHRMFEGYQAMKGESVDYSNRLYSKGKFFKIAEINSWKSFLIIYGVNKQIQIRSRLNFVS